MYRFVLRGFELFRTPIAPPGEVQVGRVWSSLVGFRGFFWLQSGLLHQSHQLVGDT